MRPAELPAQVPIFDQDYDVVVVPAITDRTGTPCRSRVYYGTRHLICINEAVPPEERPRVLAAAVSREAARVSPDGWALTLQAV